MAGPIEELPVFVRLDLGVPSQLGNRVATGEKRVAGHVAPGQRTDSPAFAAEHPDSLAIHERSKQHRSAAIALTHTEYVDVVLLESCVYSIEMQFRRDDVIVVEQENELGLRSIDRRVASNANTDVVVIEVDHVAMLCHLRIFCREPQVRP